MRKNTIASGIWPVVDSEDLGGEESAPAMESLSIDSAGAMMWDMASTRLAYAAHQLAKAEMSIDHPTDIITATNESEIAAVLTQAAANIQQHSLNILA